MSGDDRRAQSHARPADPRRDSVRSVAPQLLRRVRDAGRDRTPEEVMATITDDLLETDPAETAPSESAVTGSLDEILLALIALRDDETHGTGLMDDVERLFDVQLSPGTVYPRLHDLHADGTLARHDLVQTKQYSIADTETAADLVERAMYRHLTFGLFLRAALDAVESR